MLKNSSLNSSMFDLVYCTHMYPLLQRIFIPSSQKFFLYRLSSYKAKAHQIYFPIKNMPVRFAWSPLRVWCSVSEIVTLQRHYTCQKLTTNKREQEKFFS